MPPRHDFDEVCIWVPGPLDPGVNVRDAHWRVRKRRVDMIHKKTMLYVLDGLHRSGWTLTRTTGGILDPKAPKAIRFEVRARNLYDDDNLRSVVKHYRDALVKADIIHSDGPRSGHVFDYAQAVDRQHVGLWIVLRVLPACPAVY